MRELHQRVAVITGAASGLGFAMAERAAAAGMMLVLADVERPALERAAAVLAAQGGAVLAHACDVSDGAQVDALAEAAYQRFGAVHLLCNNAGVAGNKLAWEFSEADWRWELGVNLWGVIHGIRAFVPRMLAAGQAGHVVNTASVAGLISTPGSAVYNVSKHGVVTLSETLYQDLRAVQAPIGVSVLCPAYVNTGIGRSERNRPAELRSEREPSAMSRARQEQLAVALAKAKRTPADIAADVFAAVRDDQFYILTHPRIKGAIETRLQDILLQRPPTNPM
jgi:NAD(P)-dependent dehydrogenase (short-subunit alcohol dehydrogenase family)